MVRRPISLFRNFLDNEAAGGIILMASAALALLVANSTLAPTYFGALKAYLEHGINLRDGMYK